MTIPQIIATSPDFQDRVATLFPDLVPQHNPDYSGRNVTLFGSFAPANWTRIKDYRQQLQAHGFWVLAPHGNEFTHAIGDFGVLDADAPKLAHMQEVLGHPLSELDAKVCLEALFQMAMHRSDFCYLVGDERPDIDDGSYLGAVASLEISGVRKQVPLVASSPPSPTLDAREGESDWWHDGLLAAAEQSMYVATPQDIIAIANAGGRFALQGDQTVVKY